MTTLVLNTTQAVLKLEASTGAALRLTAVTGGTLRLGVSGLQGPPGPAGTPALSADAGNTATLGTDGKLFVPALSYQVAAW